MPIPDARRRHVPQNGATRGRIDGLAIAGGVPYPYDDPMSKVLGLDSQTSGPVAWLVYLVGAVALLLGLMVSARAVTLLLASMNDATKPTEGVTQEIEVMKEDPPPPPPPAPTEEAKPEPAPPPPARAIPHEAPPPPAPAQAGKVLTQEPDPNEPVDLTGNTIVTGNADAYAGGSTATNGTSTRAVRDLASPVGVPGGTGTPQAKPPGPDRSRAASVGGTEWNCPFPQEADTAQIDEAYVTLQVDLRADGSPEAVRVVADPGNGFGREARRCAMSKHFPAALDHDGTPIVGSFKAKVHFSR
jgi:periplasmic protein TonB